MKCPVCKNEIVRVDGRCPHCGCNLDDPQMIDRIIQEQEKEEKKTKPQRTSGSKKSIRRKLLIGVYAGVAVVVVVTCIFAVLSTQPKGDQKVVASQTQTPKPSTPKPTATSKFSFEPIIASSSVVSTPMPVDNARGDEYLYFGGYIGPANSKLRYNSDSLKWTFQVSNYYEKPVEAFYIKYTVKNGNYAQIYQSTPQWISCSVPSQDRTEKLKEVTVTMPYKKLDGAYKITFDITKVRFSDGVPMDTGGFLGGVSFLLKDD